MRILLDTNVVSELISKRPNPAVLRWIDEIDAGAAYLSVVTVGEIRKGIEKLPESDRKGRLTRWLENDLMERFAGRILVIDVAVMLTWATLVSALERNGRPLPTMDSLIAAIALRNQCSLATRNAADFEDTGVALIDPWVM